MRWIAVALALFLGACAAHSGIVDTGGGTYFVSRQGASSFSGMGNLRAEALQEAAAHCGGRAVQVVSESQSQPPFILGNYPRVDITFRCA